MSFLVVNVGSGAMTWGALPLAEEPPPRYKNTVPVTTYPLTVEKGMELYQFLAFASRTHRYRQSA